jgi:glycosyltransferase involved in cell wall biosynthesis
MVSPAERRTGQKTQLLPSRPYGQGNVTLLRLRTGNLQKTGYIEKAVSMLLLEGQLTRGILRHFVGVRFDLVLYATPPITLLRPIRVVKRRDGAATYLMLKDIFPQNALDLGILSEHGLRGLITRYYRRRERQLYTLSDRIGCMSAANVEYLLRHAPSVSSERVGICPNAIDEVGARADAAARAAVRERYGLPQDKPIVLYGGNLGRPQGIDHLIACLRAARARQDVYFVIAGEGTERARLEDFFGREQPQNACLLPYLPHAAFAALAGSCDIGLVLLDYRFTIPNFPSRLLSYLQAGLCVLACTDEASDVGRTVEQGGYGLWCPSNDPAAFLAALDRLLSADRDGMGQRAMAALRDDFSIGRACDAILEGMNREGEP